MTTSLSGVTPQQRGIVPPAHAARLAAALAAKETADDELRAAVVDALAAGGSVREVARLTGLSTNTVFRWSVEAR